MTGIKIRAAKSRYEFHQRRNGDVIELPDAKARVYYLSAFFNWKKVRPGTLRATSKKTASGYSISFDGISPAEANEARLRTSQEEI